MQVCEGLEGATVFMCVFLFMRVRVCVWCTLSVCAGRGLEIPKQALLEMITLIKPLLSKLPPHPPTPSICSLNTLNQAQVCLDAFTDASLTDNLLQQNERRGGRRHLDIFSSPLLSGQGKRMTVMNENMNENKCITYCFSFTLFLNSPLPPSPVS